MSGGAIDGFRDGWAILPFLHKPHYWRRQDLSHRYRALCGAEIDQTAYHPGARKAFAPGEFMVERCQRCAKKHPSSGSTGSR